MSDQELAAAYRESWKINHIASANQAEAAGRRRDAFEFFNEPEADANYGFWLKAETWTIEESVALSLGKNPEIVSSKTLFSEAARLLSPFRDEYRRRLFLLNRAFSNCSNADTFRRENILVWFAKNDTSVPPEISVSDNEFDIDYWRIRCLDLEEQINLLSTFEADENWQLKGKPKKTTVYKLLLGMALCAYGHRLSGSSPAPLAIEGDLRLLREQSEDELKLTVGDDMLRVILTEAADMLSASWRGTLDFSVFAAWKQKNRKQR